jgi:hypothetical protein
VPTFDKTTQFESDWKDLSDQDKALFKQAVREFVEDLGGTFRNSLRVKRVTGRDGVWEMTWAHGRKDGRATFSYGAEVRARHTHVVWRRVGRHNIFRDP